MRSRLARPPRRRRPDGRDESADVGQGRRRDRAGRLPVLRFDQAAAAVEVPRRHHGHRRAADRDLQREYTDPRQRQLFKNIIYVGALSALLDIDPEEIEHLIGEQYKGKEALLESNLQALHDRPRLRARQPRLPAAASRSGAPTPSATASSSTATAPRRSARLRRRDGGRVVSDHAVVVAGRGVRAPLPQVPHRSGERQGTATRSCRPRTSSRRSAW